MSEQRVKWVEKRGRCTPEMALLALAQIVEQDVEEMNALPAKRRHDQTYRIVKSEGQEGGLSSVQVYQQPTGSRKATFELEPEGIRIDAYPHPTMHVTICWDAESLTCHYCLEKKILAAWQVSRQALEVLFFGS